MQHLTLKVQLRVLFKATLCSVSLKLFFFAPSLSLFLSFHQFFFPVFLRYTLHIYFSILSVGNCYPYKLKTSLNCCFFFRSFLEK